MTFKDVYWLRPIAIFLKTSFECKNKTKSASLHAIFHKMQTSPRRVEGKKSCIMMHEQILVKAKKKWGFEFFTILFKLWTYIVASSHHLICIKNRQIWTGHKEIERLFSNPHALCEHLEEEEATPLSCLHSQLSFHGKFGVIHNNLSASEDSYFLSCFCLLEAASENWWGVGKTCFDQMSQMVPTISSMVKNVTMVMATTPILFLKFLCHIVFRNLIDI